MKYSVKECLQFKDSYLQEIKYSNGVTHYELTRDKGMPLITKLHYFRVNKNGALELNSKHGIPIRKTNKKTKHLNRKPQPIKNKHILFS